jgi:hypothetical protein
VDGLGGSMDDLAGLIHVFLNLFIGFTEADIWTASEKVWFTVTFRPRRMECPPQIVYFARLQ